MNVFKLAMVAAAGVALSAAAHAAPIITASVSKPADFPALGNFGAAGTNGLVSTAPIQIANSGVITFGSGSAPVAGVYSGNSTSVALAPAISSGNYLVAQASGSVTIDLGTATQTSFSLLWGTVDDYNGLTIQTKKGGATLATISGDAIASAASIQQYGTTGAYVTISNLDAFSSIVLTSGQAAFEFIPSVQVPEPASLAVLGFGLASLGLVRRRAKKA